MPVPLSDKESYEFGPFRLDSAARLLFKNGSVVPLPQKALDILVTLVEKRGSLVEKDALIAVVWPDVIVEEGNLHHHISLLRRTLGNGASDRAYIETIPRRGYRFVGNVVNVVEVHNGRDRPETPPAARAAVPPLRGHSRVVARLGIAATAVLIILAMLASWRGFTSASRRHGQQLTQRQLTANPLEDPVLGASISPDGKYLAYADLAGVHLRLIATGETRSLPLPAGFCFR